MIDGVAPTGVRVGHWTDTESRTGCTVVVLPPETVASGEVRGGAPASREFALLDPTRTVQHVDAVCLSGGSAFGLASAEGVVAGLRDDGRGFPTPAGPVPIVVGLSIFDLAVGENAPSPTAPSQEVAFPGPAEGRYAYDRASASFATGSIGAGTGATIAKWNPAKSNTARSNTAKSNADGSPSPGGFGAATVQAGDVVVTTLVVLNAFGDIDDGTAGSRVAAAALDAWPNGNGFASGTNTTIGVVITNAIGDKVACHHVAQSAHDGLARAVFPPHTTVDGDAFVAAATGEVTASIDQLRAMTIVATEAAIRSLAANI